MLYTNEENELFILDIDDINEKTVEHDEEHEHQQGIDEWIQVVEDPTVEVYDKIIDAEFLVPVGNTELLGKVTKCVRVPDRKPIRKLTDNPFTDTSMYEVHMTGVSTRELTCDKGGRQFQLISDIRYNQ